MDPHRSGFSPQIENICSSVFSSIFRKFGKINSFFDFSEISLYIFFPFCYSVNEVVPMSFFGENLKKARKRCGFTQRQLADLVGAKHNSVSNWETGQNEPDTQTIRKLCDTLSVTANDLFGSDNGTASPSISRDELKIALFEGDDKVTEDMLREVLDFAQFVKEKYRKKGEV